MNCNSSGFCAYGSNWWWIIILVIVLLWGNNGSGFLGNGCCDHNNCGCC
jgi:hypothetical protein